jgi:hypothetical protein
MKSVLGNEVARHHLFLVGEVGEIGDAYAPAVGFVRQALDHRHHRVPASDREFHRGDAELVGLFHIHFRRDMPRRALQVIGERPVILEAGPVLDELGDDFARATQLRVAEGVFEASFRQKLPLLVAQAFRHHDRAPAVAFDDPFHAREESLLVELDLRK